MCVCVCVCEVYLTAAAAAATAHRSHDVLMLLLYWGCVTATCRSLCLCHWRHMCVHTHYMDQKVHHLPLFWAGVWHGKPIGNVCINTRCVTLLCGYLQHTVRMPACLAGIVCVCAPLPPPLPPPPSLGGGGWRCVCVCVRACVTPGAFGGLQ